MARHQQIGAMFLQTELNTGLTFAWIALTSPDRSDKIARNRANARAAYDTLVRFKDSIYLTAEQSSHFESGFTRLQEKLRELGEVI
jgi:hypothetical protein